MNKKIIASLCALTLVFGAAGYLPNNAFEKQGGITANEEKVTDVHKEFGEDELKAGVMLRRGKKNYNKAVLKG